MHIHNLCCQVEFGMVSGSGMTVSLLEVQQSIANVATIFIAYFSGQRGIFKHLQQLSGQLRVAIMSYEDIKADSIYGMPFTSVCLYMYICMCVCLCVYSAQRPFGHKTLSWGFKPDPRFRQGFRGQDASVD